MAAQATLHCLTGCAIGEVLGMVLGTSFGLHNAATVVLSIVLAFVFGYGLTMHGVLRAGLPGLGRPAFGASSSSAKAPTRTHHSADLTAMLVWGLMQR